MVGSVSIESQLWAHVTTVGELDRIDAPQMAVSFAMLGIFTNADENYVVVNHRRADDVVAIRAAAKFVLRFLRIAIELPEQLGFPLSPRTSKL